MDNASDKAVTIDVEPAGTWMAPLTVGQRWTRLALWVVPTYFLTAYLFYLQFLNNAPPPYMLWGFGFFAFGTLMGVRALGIRERRVFDTIPVHYTHNQRLKRAAPWLGLGVFMLTVIWWSQLGFGQFDEYWWYAWPALLPLLLGTGLYMLKIERVLSASGTHARAQLDAAQAQVTEQRNAKIDAFLGSGLVRYVGAAGCLYIAYWMFADSTHKNSGVGAICFVALALFLARELGFLLLAVGLVAVMGWAMFAGLAALPLSVAVIIGALIIASAAGKK